MRRKAEPDSAETLKIHSIWNWKKVKIFDTCDTSSHLFGISVFTEVKTETFKSRNSERWIHIYRTGIPGFTKVKTGTLAAKSHLTIMELGDEMENLKVRK